MAAKGPEPDEQARQYQQQLAQLERQRRQWQDLEQALRRGLARLALFGFGNDARLDKQLTQLRSAIRRDDPGETVAELVTQVEQTSRALDLSKTEPDDIQRHTLLNLLNTLQFPRSLGGEVRALRRRLREPGDGEAAEQLLAEAGELIRRSQSPQSAPRRGLGRLLGGGGQDDAAETVGPEKGEAGQLGTFLHQLQPPPALEPAVRRAREQVEAGVDTEELQRIADELSEHLQSVAGQDSGEAILPTGLEDALTRLLDLLALPGEEREEVAAATESLQAWLRRGITFGELPELLREVEGQVASVRETYEREYRELEEFLQELISHLNDLNAHISATQELHSASSQGHQHLNEQLDAAMDGMASGIADASDLQALREAVQQRLDEVRANVAAHRKADRERDQAFEAEVELLYNRVKESEEEADRLKEALRQERELAHQDSLTGLPNRLGYEERIRQAAGYWRRAGGDLALMVVDIDYFKSVNDNYGHQAGDKALQAVAELLHRSLQRETDFVARYGGEEFACLLPGTGEEQAVAMAERMRRAVEQARFTYQSSNALNLTISAGVTTFRDGDTAETAFDRADSALLQAKNTGRNRIQRARD